MSSRRSYCSGESVPMTGERGSSCAPCARPSGYSLREAALP